MPSDSGYGFYLNGRYLGRHMEEAAENLTKAQARKVIIDFLLDTYDAEDLAQLAADGMPDPPELAYRALVVVWRSHRTDIGPPREYGGVTHRARPPGRSNGGKSKTARKSASKATSRRY